MANEPIKQIDMSGNNNYSGKLKEIEAVLAKAKAQAAAIGEQVRRGEQMKEGERVSLLPSKKFTKETEIPETYAYQKAFGTGQFAPITAEVKPTTGLVDLDEYTQFSTAGAANGATQKIINRTGVIEEPEPPATPVPYFGAAGDAWQDVSKRLQELAEQATTPSDRRALVESEFEKWGIEESFSLLQDITKTSQSVRAELNLVRSQEAAELAGIVDRPGVGTSFMKRETAAIEEKYSRKKANLAAELSGYAAESAMIRGNVSLARGLAMELVSASTYDEELNYKRLEDIYTLERDMFEDLADYEQEIYKEQMDAAETQWKQAVKDREQITKWATDKDLAPALYGVDLSEISLDDAAKLVSNYAGMQAVAAGEDLLSVSEAKALNLPYGTTKLEAAQMGIVPTGGVEVPKGITGANYNTRLNQEITALYSGRYGKAGAREKIITSLKGEFPGVDVAADIYRRVPDGYEKNIKRLTSIQFEWDLDED